MAILLFSVSDSSCHAYHALISCNVDFPMISYSLLYQNKKESEKDRKLNRFLANKAVIITKVAV